MAYDGSVASVGQWVVHLELNASVFAELLHQHLCLFMSKYIKVVGQFINALFVAVLHVTIRCSIPIGMVPHVQPQRPAPTGNTRVNSGGRAKYNTAKRERGKKKSV